MKYRTAAIFQAMHGAKIGIYNELAKKIPIFLSMRHKKASLRGWEAGRRDHFYYLEDELYGYACAHHVII